MSDELWDLVEEEAARQGISSAQFLREAALWRLAYHATRRDDFDLDEFLTRFATLARRARRSRPHGENADSVEPDALPPLGPRAKLDG